MRYCRALNYGDARRGVVGGGGGVVLCGEPIRPPIEQRLQEISDNMRNATPSPYHTP